MLTCRLMRTCQRKSLAMILGHPDVVRTRSHHRDMQSRSGTFHAIQENDDAIAAIVAELERIRDRHVATASIQERLPEPPPKRDRMAV